MNIDSDWRGERLADDERWACSRPPAGNCNIARVRCTVHLCASSDTFAARVMQRLGAA